MVIWREGLFGIRLFTSKFSGPKPCAIGSAHLGAASRSLAEARSRKRRVRCLCVPLLLRPLAAELDHAGGGGVPGRHFQDLRQERCVLNAPPPAVSQISIRSQGNRFIHYSRIFIWLSGLT
jgi:hypothetical protein